MMPIIAGLIFGTIALLAGIRFALAVWLLWHGPRAQGRRGGHAIQAAIDHWKEISGRQTKPPYGL